MSEAELLASMETLRAELRLSRRKELLWRAFVLTVIVVGAWLVLSQKQTTDDIISARREARGAACQSDNRFIGNHNRLVDALEQSIQLANQPNPNRTPEQQAAIDKFFADYTAAIEAARVPLRDCTPAAIEAFYKGK